MFYFIIYLMVGIGLTNILVNASILETLRQNISQKNNIIGEMLECMLCTGFWTGMFLGLFYPIINFFLLNIIISGIIISLFSNIYSIVFELLIVLRYYIQNKIEVVEDEQNKN